MKNQRLWGVVILIVVCCVSLVFNLQNSIAQEDEKRGNFNGVMPFYTTGGFFGFFDQKDGTVYIYDERMKNVKFIYKIEELGKPGVGIIDLPDVNNLGTYQAY